MFNIGKDFLQITQGYNILNWAVMVTYKKYRNSQQ